MTTTKTITVSLTDSAQDETVSAAYFQIEDGWITFKTDDGKAVVAYPEKRITRIKSEEPARAGDVYNVHLTHVGPPVNAAKAAADLSAKGHWGRNA